MLKTTKINPITNLKKPVIKKVVSTLKSGFSGWNSGQFFKTFKELVFLDVDTVYIDDFENIRFSYTDEKGTKYHFKFTAGNVDHCCALLTIGNFEISANFPESKLAEIIDTLIEATKEVIMFTTNGVNSSIPLEKTMLKSKYFKLVRTLKSTDKKRTIKMYVSNNDNS